MIIASLVLVVVDITIDNKTFSSISKILRVVFRFLRLFLLFRKVTQFKNIRKFYSHFDVKSPVEKCLEILMDARKEIDDNLMLKDIEWCMEMISSNKLYDPLMLFKKNDKDETMGQVKHNEVVNWIEQYQFKTSEGPSGPAHKKNGSIFMPNPDSAKSRRNSAMQINPTMNAIGTVPPNVISFFFFKIINN